MIGLGWIVGSLVVGAVIGAVLWETFGPFVKDILDRYVYKFFRCLIIYLGGGKYRGQVVLDGERNFERDIDESEVPEEYKAENKYTGSVVDVTYNKELRMQLGL